jgi:hypothetical protein
MREQNNPGEEPLLAGYEAMACFLTDHGLDTTKSTMSKKGAPSVNAELPAAERFPIEGYWGILPVVKPDRLLDWALRRLRPSRGEPSASHVAASGRPVQLAPVPPAQAPAAAAPTLPPPRKRGRPAKVRPAGAAAEAR